MPNMPPYSPPKTLRPITAEAYVGLATMIDVATKALAVNDARVADGCASDCMPRLDPRIGSMAATLYLYLPPELLPLDSIPLPPGMAPPTDGSDRGSHYTFRIGKAKLMTALDAMTPPEVRAELGDTSGADDPGPSGGAIWWTAALAVGGGLYFLAQRNFYVAAGAKALPVAVRLSKSIAILIASAFASKVFVQDAPEAIKWAFQAANDAIVKPAGQALAWVLGLAGVGLAGVVIYKYAAKPARQLPRSRTA